MNTTEITQAFCNTIRAEALRQADQAREGCKDCGENGQYLCGLTPKCQGGGCDYDTGNNCSIEVTSNRVILRPCPTCTPEVERLKAIADKWRYFDKDEYYKLIKGEIPPPCPNPNPTIGSGTHDIVKVCEELGLWDEFVEWHWQSCQVTFKLAERPIPLWGFISEFNRSAGSTILTTPALLMQAITNWTEVKG